MNSKLPDADYYDLLGVTSDATAEEIRLAYHEAARRLHPDINPEPGATEQFLSIQAAYEVLSDPKKRRDYDSTHEADKTFPLNVNVVYSRAGLAQSSEQQLIYALLELTVPAGVPSKPAPLNLCLVIDHSTSMQGERMDTVKSAAIELVRNLQEQDLISVIAFADRAEIILPAGRKADKEEVETKIRRLHPSGGTEILRGLEAGFFEVRRNLNRNRVNHIILLTDGRTYGDEGMCLNIADKAAAFGVRISCLGIGEEWNDAFLDNLATRTGGSSSYVSRPEEIRNIFREIFRQLNQTFAEQVAYQFIPGKGVQLRYAFRVHPNAVPLPLGSPLRLGSIEKNSIVSVVLEFVVDPITSDQPRVILGSGKLMLDTLAQVDGKQERPLNLVRAVNTAALQSEPCPRSLIQAMSKITLYRLQDKARQEVGIGNVEDASRHLQYLATNLLSAGERDLAQTALIEAERIQYTQAFSERGEKSIKYGTRALLLPSAREKQL